MTDELKALADLLPCPFCGKGSEVSRFYYDPANVDPTERERWKILHNGDWGCPVHFYRSFGTEAEAVAAWNARDNLPAIIEQRAEIERLRDIIASLCRKVEVQADCLIRYAEQNGEKAKPLPSVYHIQASHFCDFAREARAALNPTGEA